MHPSLFGCVDGLGKFDLWDININHEAPIYSTEICKSALTRLAWSDDGKRLSLGDSNGKIYLYNIAKEITKSTADDATKLERVLAQAKSNFD